MSTYSYRPPSSSSSKSNCPRGYDDSTRRAFWIVGEEGGEANGGVKEVIVDGDDGDLGAYL